MKRIQPIATVIIALLAIAFSGCSKGAPASGNETKAANSNAAANTITPAKNESASSNSPAPAPSASQTNANRNPADAKPAERSNATDGPVDVSKLVGVYEMVQVQKEGVVNMISQLKTRITFNTEGTYRRESRVKGKIYHEDTGQFRVENGDQLVLVIQMSKKHILNPRIEKRQKINLSPDGEEMKLTSNDGGTAMFHKVRA
jgi:hypothetical protein